LKLKNTQKQGFLFWRVKTKIKENIYKIPIINKKHVQVLNKATKFLDAILHA
jgi:hypothetical protein